MYKVVKNIFNTHQQNKMNTKLNKAQGHKQISKIIKAQQPATMASMKRTNDMGPGKPVGSITTNFTEIDNILSDTWRKITHGAEEDPATIATRFMQKYQNHIYVGKEFKVNKITAEDLIETCRVNTASAAGLDGWQPKDLALLSDKALQVLADLLNTIDPS